MGRKKCVLLIQYSQTSPQPVRKEAMVTNIAGPFYLTNRHGKVARLQTVMFNVMIVEQ